MFACDITRLKQVDIATLPYMISLCNNMIKYNVLNMLLYIIFL